MLLHQPLRRQSQADLPGRRTPSHRAFWLAALLVCVGLFAAPAIAQSPDQLKPQGYVNDFAGVLSPAARAQLTALCTEVDQKAQAQIAIVTVKSLGGQSVFDYSLDLATRWGVGPKGKDRGILILFAIDDHKYWTQVGYGLEEILPDGKVGGFGREAVPLLREGNYDGAVELYTRRIADVIAGAHGVTLSGSAPAPAPVERERGNDASPGVIGIILLLVILYLVIRAMSHFGGPGTGYHRGGGGWWIGPMIGGGWGGGGFGGGGWGGGGGGGGSGGFGGFGGGSFGGGGAGGSW